MLLMITATTASGREVENTWIKGVYTGASPRPKILAEEKAWQQAVALVENTPGTFVLVGSGRSMQPLYPPDTILVLRQRPYQELQRGQTVLYRNQQNKVIAHVLVTRTRDGWRVRGLNNVSHDMEPVQPGNLVGVVVAAYKPTPMLQPLQIVAVR
jgi:phage repressor protein C with HTH and peptisase S24 domain